MGGARKVIVQFLNSFRQKTYMDGNKDTETDVQIGRDTEELGKKKRDKDTEIKLRKGMEVKRMGELL